MSRITCIEFLPCFFGMDASLISRMKILEEESKHLKGMRAEKNMQNNFLKEALGKVVRPSHRPTPAAVCNIMPQCGGLTARMAHMTGHLALYFLAGIIEVMSFGFAGDSGGYRRF